MFPFPTDACALEAATASILINGEEISNIGIRLLSEDKSYGSGLFSRFQSEIYGHIEPHIIEIGSRARSGNIYKLSDTANYMGFDILDGPNVDVVGDVHRLSQYISAKFDFAVSISVWEHLAMPWVAAVELAKVMKPDGIAYIQSHQAWPVHDSPWDFFRFSSDAWKCLFHKKSGWEVLGVEHSIPAYCTPLLESGNKSLHFGCDGRNVGYLKSSCLVKRNNIHPSLDWAVTLNDLVANSYPE